MSWFPSGLVVTRLAVAAICATGKLSCVLIGVTIETPRERDMLFEILGFVTILASDCGMFSDQRIIGLAVVKPVRGENLFPAAGDVAARAIAAEAAAVGILVTRRAVSEKGKILVLDGGAYGRRSRPVAFGTLHIGV